ncbi:uncharacterized protein EAE97_003470 [Botrytis byssoidea]|uniref:F-box domain-containing protein n=1 Tax=Botrytis byssoidea TaxID=139641 RepID=A0A9P5LWC2_9HELO|nr:uncharacterized protein EAE97_003470 [Botrytis byssoidea]KAF7948059.1 hypothetical protein EAE97_003470 [Botrytis byssoidea]
MKSYLPLELWILLADQRLPKKTLTTLCLTSKKLNEVFRPALYREIVLPEFSDVSGHLSNNGQLWGISQLPVETHLRHTRRLDSGFVVWRTRATLSRCLNSMSNLESCSISTIPGFAAYFHLNEIRDIYIDLWKNSPHFPSFHGWPNLPDFRNLHSLDLRGLKGDLEVLSTSIAKILFNDGMPTVTALGLDLDDLQGGETTNNLFLDIFAEFDRRRRAIGRPDLRLNLRDLILGKGMYHPSAGMD